MKPFDFSHAEQLIGKAVKHKDSEEIYLITAVIGTGVTLYSLKYTYDILFEDFTFLDGTPCGVEEEYNLTFIDVLQTAKEGDRFLSETLNNNFECYKNNEFYDSNDNLIILTEAVLIDKYKKL